MDKWLFPNTSLTCWEKAHSFYIPNGLFHSNLFYRESFNNKVDFNETAKFDLKSKLYLLRKETLRNATPRSSPLTLLENLKPNDGEYIAKEDQQSVNLAAIDILMEPVKVPRLE